MAPATPRLASGSPPLPTRSPAPASPQLLHPPRRPVKTTRQRGSDLLQFNPGNVTRKSTHPSSGRRGRPIRAGARLLRAESGHIARCFRFTSAFARYLLHDPLQAASRGRPSTATNPRSTVPSSAQLEAGPLPALRLDPHTNRIGFIPTRCAHQPEPLRWHSTAS